MPKGYTLLTDLVNTRLDQLRSPGIVHLRAPGIGNFVLVNYDPPKEGKPDKIHDVELITGIGKGVVRIVRQDTQDIQVLDAAEDVKLPIVFKTPVVALIFAKDTESGLWMAGPRELTVVNRPAFDALTDRISFKLAQKTAAPNPAK